MAKLVIAAGNVAGLLARFSELRRKAEARTSKRYTFVVSQGTGPDGFWMRIPGSSRSAFRDDGDQMRVVLAV